MNLIIWIVYKIKCIFQLIKHYKKMINEIKKIRRNAKKIDILHFFTFFIFYLDYNNEK